MKLLGRLIYTDRVIPFINKQVIKVLTGQRRVGKSYVMLQLMEHIKCTNKNANIIYINMELDDYIHIRIHLDLNSFLEDKFIEGKATISLLKKFRKYMNLSGRCVVWNYSKKPSGLFNP